MNRNRFIISISFVFLLAATLAGRWHFSVLDRYGSHADRRTIHDIIERKKHHQRNPGFERQLVEEKFGDGPGRPYGQLQRWLDQDRMLLANNRMDSPFSDIVEMGPSNVGGRTRAIHIDPQNPDRIIAGGVSGGIWISNDRGLNWEVLNDFADNLTVTGMTYDPFDPSVIYYSTGEARGGGGIGEGIYKSTDNGQSFSVLPGSLDVPEFRYTWKIEHSHTEPNTVYVGTYRGLFRTTDGGATWESVLNIEGNDANDVLCFDDGSVMAAIEEVGIFYSPNGDAGTYTPVTSESFPEEFTRIKLAYCATQQNFLYAMFAVDIISSDAPKVCRSTNGGQTWERKATPLITGTQRRYNMMLGVHPTNPARVVAGTVLSNFSDNGGTTWFFTGLSHSDYHEYAFFPDNHNQFLVGNDGGIYLHRWNDILITTERNRGYNVTQFYGGSYHPDSIAVIGGTQDNGTIRVKPGGQFSYVFGADGGYAHVDQQDPTIAYFSTQLTGLFRVENWAENIAVPVPIMYSPMANEGVSFINNYEMNYSDGRQLYYRTNLGVWRTANRGGQWERIGVDTFSSIRRLSLSEESDPYLYFAAMNDEEGMQLYRNTDAATGATTETFLNSADFEELFNTSSVNVDIHPQNNDRILFSYYNYTGNSDQCWMVANTWNNDSSFINVSGDLPENLPVNVLLFHPQRPDSIFLAATDFGLYYTLDAGQHWQKETRMPNVQIFDMRIRPDGKVFFYTFGRGIWSGTLADHPLQPATLPHREDFDSGSWSRAGRASRNSANGRVKITPRDTIPLFYYLSLDMSRDEGVEGSCSFTLDVDPGQAEQLVITYFYFLHGDMVESPLSGVYIREHAGGTEQQWRAFDELTVTPFGQDSILYPVTDTGLISVRFEFWGMREIPEGGISLALIEIRESEIQQPTGTVSDLAGMIDVYPNPARSHVNYNLPSEPDVERIELHDRNGRLIFTWTGPDRSTGRLTIPDGLASGSYFLSFIAGPDDRAVKKIFLVK